MTPSRIYGDVVAPDLQFGLIASQAGGQLSAVLDIDRALRDSLFEDEVPYSLKNQLGSMQFKDVNFVLDVSAITPGEIDLTIAGLVATTEFTQANERQTISLSVNDLPEADRQALANVYLSDLGEFSITADDGEQFIYDVTIEGTNHRFVPNTAPSNSANNPLLLGYADMRNVSISPGLLYEH